MIKSTDRFDLGTLFINNSSKEVFMLVETDYGKYALVVVEGPKSELGRRWTCPFKSETDNISGKDLIEYIGEWALKDFEVLVQNESKSDKVITIPRSLLREAMEQIDTLSDIFKDKREFWKDQITEIAQENFLNDKIEVSAELLDHAINDFSTCSVWKKKLTELKPKVEYFKFDEIKTDNDDLRFGSSIFDTDTPFYVGENYVKPSYRYQCLMIGKDYEIETLPIDQVANDTHIDSVKLNVSTVIRFKKK